MARAVLATLAKFGTQVHIGERAVGCDLNEVVAEGAERGDEEGVVTF